MGDKSNSDSTYVTLVSEDDYRFILPKEAAILSNTLKDMLSDDIGMLESESGVVNLNHSAPVVEKLCEYLIFKLSHLQAEKLGQPIPTSTNFDHRIPIEMALQL
ncbi:hypothetical protein DFH28DRAFT_1119095 [Melampsora americana]|nr:hypothetical protein DFH28DRAFT_1119095 [Melampsora americana]